MADPTAPELAAQFGYAAAFFQAIPELNNLLNQAVREHWTPARFQAGFMNSNWYRSTSASARQWSTLQTSDPASASQKLNDTMNKIGTLASQMGVTIDGNRLNQMANAAISGGYSDDVLRSAIAAEWHYTPGNTSGSAGGAAGAEAAMRKLASDYGVTVNDSDMAGMVQGVLSGRMTQDSMADFVRDQARSKYPGMKDWIDQGLTVKQVASPYTSSYAKLMEVDPDTVKLDDPAVQRALQGGKNSQGAWQQQTLYDFEKQLRNDPRWLKTKNARDDVSNTTNNVLRDMGLIS